MATPLHASCDRVLPLCAENVAAVTAAPVSAQAVPTCRILPAQPAPAPNVVLQGKSVAATLPVPPAAHPLSPSKKAASAYNLAGGAAGAAPVSGKAIGGLATLTASSHATAKPLAAPTASEDDAMDG